MARGRQSSTIKVITGRDKDLLQQLSKTGVCTSPQAKEYAGVSADRLNKLEKSGYVKTSNHIVRGENNRIIQLDKSGVEYCRQELGVNRLCIAQTNHLAHDIKLTEIYYKLEPKVQDTWRHESDLIRDYYAKFPEQEGKLTTCIDATVEINGEAIAIESVGASYSSNTIQIKQEVAQSLGCSRMECV
jgi:DNA-binding PadR family transcriptional regulator